MCHPRSVPWALLAVVLGCGAPHAGTVEPAPEAHATAAPSRAASAELVDGSFELAGDPSGSMHILWVAGEGTLDTGMVGTNCHHDAWRDCSHDPAVIRRHFSCLTTDGTGPELEVRRDGSGSCAVRAREIDADHAARGTYPEWSTVATVPCPSEGPACPIPPT